MGIAIEDARRVARFRELQRVEDARIVMAKADRVCRRSASPQNLFAHDAAWQNWARLYQAAGFTL